MRKVVLALIVWLVPATVAVAGVPGRFIQTPDISGNTIVFTWERDLWIVPATGGTAQQLTSHPGTESDAKFSPDGKWIAFTGNDKGQWLIENHGGDPDILVENDPASASAGRDAQLEKAVEVLLKQIKENPFSWPAVPKYPIR